MKEETIYKGVMVADGYERIDGQSAYCSQVKKMTIGKPTRKENENAKIAIQIWREDEKRQLEIDTEIPIHQVLDMMIFISRTMLHFREAYRFPLLYDPANPEIERVGIQGDAVSLAVDTENEKIAEDIQDFSQALSDLGEITGERLHMLKRIMQELEY